MIRIVCENGERQEEREMDLQMEEKKIPKKIAAMYQAVQELIEEGADINRIKVLEITQRAGIGKGTAYEYFSNKEELISSALLYQMNGIYSQLEEQIAKKESFEESIQFVLSSIVEKIGQRDCFLRYVHIFTDNGPISAMMKQKIQEQKNHDTCLALDCIRQMVQIGKRTGEISTKLPEAYIYMEILSKVIGFAVYLAGEWGIEGCNREEMKALICASLKKELAES